MLQNGRALTVSGAGATARGVLKVGVDLDTAIRMIQPHQYPANSETEQNAYCQSLKNFFLWDDSAAADASVGRF